MWHAALDRVATVSRGYTAVLIPLHQIVCSACTSCTPSSPYIVVGSCVPDRLACFPAVMGSHLRHCFLTAGPQDHGPASPPCLLVPPPCLSPPPPPPIPACVRCLLASLPPLSSGLLGGSGSSGFLVIEGGGGGGGSQADHQETRTIRGSSSI